MLTQGCGTTKNDSLLMVGIENLTAALEDSAAMSKLNIVLLSNLSIAP